MANVLNTVVADTRKKPIIGGQPAFWTKALGLKVLLLGRDDAFECRKRLQCARSNVLHIFFVASAFEIRTVIVKVRVNDKCIFASHFWNAVNREPPKNA